MKQRFPTMRRISSVLIALLFLTFAAACSLIDPVVSVGTPMPDATDVNSPSDNALPPTPSAKPVTPLIQPLPNLRKAGADSSSALMTCRDF